MSEKNKSYCRHADRFEDDKLFNKMVADKVVSKWSVGVYGHEKGFHEGWSACARAIRAKRKVKP